jgi:hypothetical protein
VSGHFGGQFEAARMDWSLKRPVRSGGRRRSEGTELCPQVSPRSLSDGLNARRRVKNERKEKGPTRCGRPRRPSEGGDPINGTCSYQPPRLGGVNPRRRIHLLRMGRQSWSWASFWSREIA